MASLVLGAAGSAIGGALLPGSVSAFGLSVGGATIGGFAGDLAGSAVDSALFASDIQGPRLEELQLQRSTEGAGMALVYGKARLAGQVIWAARFVESQRDRQAGKGGPTVREFTYSLSFAVGLGEGPIDSVGRIWADGALMDVSSATWRVYRGDETQTPDPLIQAIESADAPAFRGTAYIVFEDLDLEPFGNRVPNLTVEVNRIPPEQPHSPPRLETLVQGVALIPSSGEFSYATQPIYHLTGEGERQAENVNNSRGDPDIIAALDDLEAQLPNCRSITFVVSWFGTDLRAGQCQIRPGVEFQEKATTPDVWRVGGETRDTAYLVSRIDNRPAYGGTPADWSVIDAIAEMKKRGFDVVFYPFILMDIPASSGLPDPYGRDEQPPFPWRGRITCDPAAGQAGTVDKTADAGDQVAALFGVAAVDDFAIGTGEPVYNGPDEWSIRRMILHYAHLCKLAGGVDAFMIGSEMRGLTTVRDSADHYPAVDEFVTLAEDVKSVLPSAQISYAADWSEYFGHQPQDGTGDVFHHLDPLWASDDVAFVGIDWYGPLSDWRDGSEHLDADLSPSIYRLDYLTAQVEGGEGFDWYYASSTDRDAQARTDITDGAYGEPHVYRYKDLRNWWGLAHHDRPGGVRSASATAWQPESKPIRFTEIGCPAIDKGANQPNVFYDPKSSESFFPYYSTGDRDDLIQRRYIEAMLIYWDPNAGNNPVSSQYAGRMLDMSGAHVWTWDARPYPDFPARTDIWTDGGNWRLGHWLTGRVGRVTLADVVIDVTARAGLTAIDVSALEGLVAGYALPGPMPGRDALAPLAQAYRFDMIDKPDAAHFLSRAAALDFGPIDLDAALLPDSGDLFRLQRPQPGDHPRDAVVRYIDESKEMQPGAASALNRDLTHEQSVTLNAPLLMDARQAADIAQTALSEALAEGWSLRLRLPPSAPALETGDLASCLGRDWRVASITEGSAREIALSGAVEAATRGVAGPDPGVLQPWVRKPTPPALVFIDGAFPIAGRQDDQPLVAARAKPWPGRLSVWAGPDADSLDSRLVLREPAVMGETLWDLYPGAIGRWDDGNRIQVRVYSGALASADRLAVLNGANRFAVQTPGGEWEAFQAREAIFVSDGVYELRGLLRGQFGSDAAMSGVTPAGSRIVVLDDRLAPLDTEGLARGADIALSAAAEGLTPVSDSATHLTALWLGRGLRPFSPVHLRVKRESEGVQISWRRRSRIDGEDWAAVDIPLGEADEAYEVDVLDSGSVEATLIANSPSVLLTAAEETAIFGGPVQSIHVLVYQISQAYGRGAPADRVLYL